MSRYSNYNRDPRQITARFDSKCHETGKLIKKGEQCIYYPVGKSVYCLESKQANSFRSWKMDLAMGFDY